MNRTKPLAQLARLSTLALVLHWGISLGQGAPATVQLAQSNDQGHYLVTSDGVALYAFLNDSDGNSVCYDACATNWPPLLTDGVPEAGDGVDAGLLGITIRQDGNAQVTYNGWPLYTFIRDSEPGDTVGQGVNGVWYLISPAGEAIGAATSAELSVDELMRLGGGVFNQYCAGCHGVAGNQALASHAAILDGYGRLRDGNRAIRAVINGRGYMPAIGAGLSNEEVAAVVTYVRNSWSNSHGAVTLADVAAIR